MTDNQNSLYKTEISLPGKQNNYETAYRDAAGKVSLKSIDEIAEQSGAIIVTTGSGKALNLFFLGDEIQVTHPEISVAYAEKEEEVPLWAKILVLHYCGRAGGAAAAGEEITFKQLEGGLGYYPAFQRRSIEPLLKAFGPDLDRFMRAGIAAGGTRSPRGDRALSFSAFPRVAVTFILWSGDDEFPPSGSVVFDASVPDYLSTEDMAVLCNMIAVNILRTPIPL